MYNPFSLIGKTILVTGASSGIGRSIAIECSKLGADIILTGRNEGRLIETISQLEKGQHKYIIADIAIEEIEEVKIRDEAYEGNNNGMVRVSEVFRGSEVYGEVELKNVYRSRIASIAEKM